uniref:Transcobalamin-2 n=1 Tax=Athene cunicularia TaxID=194338 RepID=A0A663LX48_ATHCN
DPDPSVYLALRLGTDHDLGVGADAVVCRSAEVEWPETGRLALYLLGLRATCPPPEPGPQRSLVTWLKYYLEEDWAGSRRHGHPLTSYYQYSLGVLALCVHRKRVREEVIRRLLVAEHHGRFGHTSDTEAVAALAFACLQRERLVGARLSAELGAATRAVRRRMVEAQGQDGFFGNIYSTPWAMQVVVMCRGGLGWAYSRAMAALLGHLDAFSTAATMAQVLPVLHGRSYLDIASMRCQEEVATCPAPMPRAHPSPQHLAPLAADLPHCWQCWGRTRSSPLLPPTRFDTQDTPQGPFLSSVLGLEARQQKRNYWQLLTAPSTSLQMGIADYRPRDGETLILRLSEW